MTFAHERWQESMNLLYELFPKWRPTDEQVRIWREAFGNRNQDWMQQAFRAHFESSGRYNTPTIEGVRKALAEIVPAQHVRTPAGYGVPDVDPAPYEQDALEILADLRKIHPEVLRGHFDALLVKFPMFRAWQKHRSEPLEAWDPFIRGIVWAYLNPAELVR